LPTGRPFVLFASSWVDKKQIAGSLIDTTRSAAFPNGLLSRPDLNVATSFCNDNVHGQYNQRGHPCTCLLYIHFRLLTVTSHANITCGGSLVHAHRFGNSNHLHLRSAAPLNLSIAQSSIPHMHMLHFGRKTKNRLASVCLFRDIIAGISRRP
jgi:hypothetical protein